jgi:hypothetical protein
MSGTEGGKPKRLSSQMRDDNLQRGAFLVEFKQPTERYDVFQSEARKSEFAGVKPAMLQGVKLQSVVDQYRNMERKGFRVTKDIGCLIPDDQYSTYQPGSTLKGHQRSVGFFCGFIPTKDDGFGLRNEFGWPCTLQISHKCHRRSCCRIDHIIVEEQWRNLKRNYCGFSGDCDCGSDIPCLRRYYTSDFAEVPQYCTTKAEVEEALAGAPPHIVRPSGYYANRDAKAKQRKANREKRSRQGAKMQHASAKKQAKHVAKMLPVIVEDDTDGFED